MIHLGVDETAWLFTTREHTALFVSGLVDTLSGWLLGVVADRTVRAVTGWLARRDPAWLARISVALNPYRVGMTGRKQVNVATAAS